MPEMTPKEVMMGDIGQFFCSIAVKPTSDLELVTFCSDVGAMIINPKYTLYIGNLHLPDLPTKV